MMTCEAMYRCLPASGSVTVTGEASRSNTPNECNVFKFGCFHVFPRTKATIRRSRNPPNAYGRETLW